MAIDKNKIVEKIKKCLALGKSSNVNEAAAALRQAQKLMAAWNVTDSDLAGAGYGFEAVDLPVQVNKKAVPIQILILNDLIRKAFGVRPVISYSQRQSDLSYQIKIFGPDHRTPMAAYACTVVYRACNGAWMTYLRENSHVRGQRGARATFMVEWLAAVRDTVMECGFSDEEEIGTEVAIQSVYGSKGLKKCGPSNIAFNHETADAGRDAASAFQLNRPMDTNRDKLEKF